MNSPQPALSLPSLVGRGTTGAVMYCRPVSFFIAHEAWESMGNSLPV